MLPKKSYSFVCFDTITSAARAQEELTGFQLREGKDPSQNIRLYLFFVSQGKYNYKYYAKCPIVNPNNKL